MLIEHRDGFVSTTDRIKLYEQSWISDAPKRGLILFVHGFAEHCDRYRPFADYFVSRGFVVTAYDNRGHGRSDGTRTYVNRFSEYLDDLSLMLRRAMDTANGLPVFLVGHSMGGLISLLYSATRDTSHIRGLIVSSPMCKIAVEVPPIKKKLGMFMSNFLPSFALPNGIDSMNLSHDETVISRYDRDPLIIKTATARWFSESLKAMETLQARAHDIKLPLLCLQAGADKLVDPSATKKIYDASGSLDKTFKLFDDYYHELFNEIGKMAVFEVMESWMNLHL